MSDKMTPLPHPHPDPREELLAGGTYPGERPEDQTVPPDPEELERRRRVRDLDERNEKFRPDRPRSEPRDPVEQASWESFPASDAPSWTP